MFASLFKLWNISEGSLLTLLPEFSSLRGGGGGGCHGVSIGLIKELMDVTMRNTRNPSSRCHFLPIINANQSLFSSTFKMQVLAPCREDCEGTSDGADTFNLISTMSMCCTLYHCALVLKSEGVLLSCSCTLLADGGKGGGAGAGVMMRCDFASL